MRGDRGPALCARRPEKASGSPPWSFAKPWHSGTQADTRMDPVGVYDELLKACQRQA